MQDWQDKAACRGVDIETFYEADDFVSPELNTRDARMRENTERRLRARLICSVCPVQQECLTASLDSDDQWAFLGGLSPAQRKRVQDGTPLAEVLPSRTWERPPNKSRGWALVRRFAAGERLDDLIEEYGLVRQTVLEEIRSATNTGEWATTLSTPAVA